MASRIPLNDLENSRGRLNRILASRRLIFNPYKVSDRRLLDIVERSVWGDEFDIVQVLTMTFTRLRPVNDVRRFDGIYAKVGPYQGETFIWAPALTDGITAFDSLRKERSTIGKQRITNEGHVASLVGKRVFISRVIKGRNLKGYESPAYKMTRMTGNPAKDAAAVRTAMCDAKIEMLRRILDYPDCLHYLDCSQGFFDYESRILRAINIIENYSSNTVPND